MVHDEYQQISVVDSHTGGEPTRVVISGGPILKSKSLRERVEELRTHHDAFRSAVVNEPRGSDVMVGALLCEPMDPECLTGVIFFNNVGYLGMCGHGTIGVVATLAYLGRIRPGEFAIETPVGVVQVRLHERGSITVNNVASYRLLANVAVVVPPYGTVRGDVAWGGNWFFLIRDHSEEIVASRIESLTTFAWSVRQALQQSGITGENGQEIDHIELFGPSPTPGVNSKNFVLCPGKAYDRSPCGTGTSAKLACLYADGKLREGDVWRQESIVGSVFEGAVRIRDGKAYPRISGTAHINAEAELIFDPKDPFRFGIRS